TGRCRWWCPAFGADIRRWRGGGGQGRLVNRADAARRRQGDRLGERQEHTAPPGRLFADACRTLATRPTEPGDDRCRQRQPGAFAVVVALRAEQRWRPAET